MTDSTDASLGQIHPFFFSDRCWHELGTSATASYFRPTFGQILLAAELCGYCYNGFSWGPFFYSITGIRWLFLTDPFEGQFGQLYEPAFVSGGHF